MQSDFTKREVEILIDLIKADNGGKALSPAQITFGLPYAYTPTAQIPRNTVIVGTAVEGGLYEGSQTFYYNRVHLDEFVEWGVTNLTFVVNEERYFTDLLPEINQRLNIRLEEERVYNALLPDFSPGKPQIATIRLEANPDSICYLGSININLVNSGIDLKDLLWDTSLSGLTYEPDLIISVR